MVSMVSMVGMVSMVEMVSMVGTGVFEAGGELAEEEEAV